ncbi:sulfatase-like hydrolase/transferase [Vallitalea okinawensis]|uniref:sulfatase-like hydrolase/transferase n=1 Tax=Vallitalea okinawensis TaxID=2078660 RepID=UPI000CFBCE18|nr:sulfatase-like hydrolase/transferase [Vallitalea okinawensis]
MKPNILMIMTDQQRFDSVSYYGKKVPSTPHLDSLAVESIVFSNTYTPSPVCAPARAAIKSGQYPPGCGVINNWVEFKEGTELMTDRLIKQDYSTALCGKLHFVPHKNNFGFQYRKLNDAPYSTYADDDRYSDYLEWLRDNYFDDKNIDPVVLFDKDEESFDSNIFQFSMGSDFRLEEEHDIPWTVEESIQFMERRDKEKPFFLFTSFFGPHQPYMPPLPWKNMYDHKEIELPPQFYASMEKSPIFEKTVGNLRKRISETYSAQDYKKLLAAYYGQISMIDHYIGKLLSYLKENQLWNNTMIIFVSDHGDYMGAYELFFKGQMYDACCKVPMFIKPPHGNSRGAIRDEVVNSLDLYGTILDIAGDQKWKKDNIESRSLVDLLNNDNTKWRNETYSIIGEKKDYNLTMLRKDHLKLMRLACGEDEPIYEMYDLMDEIAEVRNIYNVDSYKYEREDLKHQLDKWWKQQRNKYPEKTISHRKNNVKSK